MSIVFRRRQTKGLTKSLNTTSCLVTNPDKTPEPYLPLIFWAFLVPRDVIHEARRSAHLQTRTKRFMLDSSEAASASSDMLLLNTMQLLHYFCEVSDGTENRFHSQRKIVQVTCSRRMCSKQQEKPGRRITTMSKKPRKGVLRGEVGIGPKMESLDSLGPAQPEGRHRMPLPISQQVFASNSFGSTSPALLNRGLIDLTEQTPCTMRGQVESVQTESLACMGT